jgi:hypothetical protein
MRFQRRAHRGSRPEGLGHPKPTLYTAESYRARFVRPGPNASLNRLMRWVRMRRQEIEGKGETA